MNLSEPMRDVLEWLIAYPGVEIGWVPLGHSPWWTSSWCSEAARLHMVGAIGDLGGDATGTAARSRPRGGTPRLTTQTFNALLRRGYVKRTRYTLARGVMSGMNYYQISRDGIAAIRNGLRVSA